MQNKIYRNILFLILIGFSNVLLASQTKLLTQYRLHGTHGLEKLLDKSLADSSYWKSYIKHIDTKFGYLESYDNVLACNKSKHRLLVYSKDSKHDYALNKKYGAYTGKKKGDKKTEGDLRTPVGVYDLVKKISNVDEFYGPLAFVTSYPNLYDRYKGKTGKGIWIHGLPLHEDRDKFTKGCIAIGNSNLVCLSKDINLKKTLLIINEKYNYKKVTKDELATVLAQLYAWRYAWKYNNLEDYLNFYAQDFIRFDGMHIDKFKRYKKRIFSKNEKKTILFTDLNVIPYPIHKSTFKVIFREFYKTSSFTFRGKKTLIVRLKDSKMKIITEE